MNRIKVTSGKYKIGDEIEGHKITGFGKSWEEVKPALGFCQNGQRWDEECGDCKRTTVIDNDCGLCEKCYNEANSTQIQTVQYAYIENHVLGENKNE
jgi:hypothetical protein